MSATKIGENTTNILKLLYFTINLHFVTSNQISAYRKLNFPLTSSTYFVFLRLEMQKWLEQAKIYHAFFYFVWKETTHKPLKVAPAKTLFSSVYVIGTTCFNECFSFYVITRRHCFSWKINVTLRFFLSAMLLLSLKQVSWMKFVFYLHNNNMMLIQKSSSKIKLNFLVFVTNCTFVTVQGFSLQVKFFFINKFF